MYPNKDCSNIMQEKSNCFDETVAQKIVVSIYIDTDASSIYSIVQYHQEIAVISFKDWF